MITTNIYEKPIEQIFVRLATKKEKAGGINRRKGFNSIPDLEGYEITYKPYGENGAGYYYSREITE